MRSDLLLSFTLAALAAIVGVPLGFLMGWLL